MSVTDYNVKVIEDFRAGGGSVEGLPFPILLLHHFGAKTGTERVNPLAYLPDGDRYVLFASKAGAPTNPAWYHNLKAHPDVTIEVGETLVEVHAEEATGAERDAYFATQAEAVPQFAGYAENTSRTIPVIVLTPRETSAG
jgi:deazaflavin-dependent oxidoreductase (nitroreductase family)